MPWEPIKLMVIRADARRAGSYSGWPDVGGDGAESESPVSSKSIFNRVRLRVSNKQPTPATINMAAKYLNRPLSYASSTIADVELRANSSQPVTLAMRRLRRSRMPPKLSVVVRERTSQRTCSSICRRSFEPSSSLLRISRSFSKTVRTLFAARCDTTLLISATMIAPVAAMSATAMKATYGQEPLAKCKWRPDTPPALSLQTTCARRIRPAGP
jgi:hypothetical protein